MSTSGDRNPRLQAKRRVGEVASCDETAAAITRCAFKVHLVWGKKYRFVPTSSTIMGKKMGWPRKTVGFKPTAFEPLALQARVVQFDREKKIVLEYGPILNWVRKNYSCVAFQRWAKGIYDVNIIQG